MVIKVSVLDGRLDHVAGQRNGAVLTTYETDQFLNPGDTLTLEDGTPVVVIGILDRVDTSGTKPHQFVTVGTYFDVLDAKAS